MLRLFPTFVCQCDLDREHYRRVNRRIIPTIDELLPDRDDDKGRDCRNIHPDLHHMNEFSELVEVFHFALEGILHYLKINPKGGMKLTGC